MSEKSASEQLDHEAYLQIANAFLNINDGFSTIEHWDRIHPLMREAIDEKLKDPPDFHECHTMCESHELILTFVPSGLRMEAIYHYDNPKRIFGFFGRYFYDEPYPSSRHSVVASVEDWRIFINACRKGWELR